MEEFSLINFRISGETFAHFDNTGIRNTFGSWGHLVLQVSPQTMTQVNKTVSPTIWQSERTRFILMNFTPPLWNWQIFRRGALSDC